MGTTQGTDQSAHPSRLIMTAPVFKQCSSKSEESFQ